MVSWAAEAFKVVLGQLEVMVRPLSLTYLKEQELIGWAHSITDGLFRSTAAVCELIEEMVASADAVYFCCGASG
mgnify:CR=1 FL=1